MDELITYLRDKVRLREAIDNPEDGLILLQAVRDFFEHKLNQCRAFGSRQADLLIGRLI